MTKDDIVGFGANDVIGVVFGSAGSDKVSCLALLVFLILMEQEGFTAGCFGV